MGALGQELETCEQNLDELQRIHQDLIRALAAEREERLALQREVEKVRDKVHEINVILITLRLELSPGQ